LLPKEVSFIDSSIYQDQMTHSVDTKFSFMKNFNGASIKEEAKSMLENISEPHPLSVKNEREESLLPEDGFDNINTMMENYSKIDAGKS